MNRTYITVVVTVAVFALFGIRLMLVRGGELKSSRYLPSQDLAAEHPGHPLGLEKPDTAVTPPYHKPANMPGDWWLRHHPIAQRHGDFNTVECQKCHDVETYCNRCHGYLGVKSVDPVGKTSEEAPVPASKPAGK